MQKCQRCGAEGHGSYNSEGLCEDCWIGPWDLSEQFLRSLELRGQLEAACDRLGRRYTKKDTDNDLLRKIRRATAAKPGQSSGVRAGDRSGTPQVEGGR